MPYLAALGQEPQAVGQDNLPGYGKTIKLHSGNALVVHRSEKSRVVILGYEVHGKILSSDEPYDNRLISVVTIDHRKIIHWRDYMDSLAARRALNNSQFEVLPCNSLNETGRAFCGVDRHVYLLEPRPSNPLVAVQLSYGGTPVTADLLYDGHCRAK
jgi:hypothetical protein